MKSFAAAAVLLVPLALASCTEEAAGPLSEKREPADLSISAADIELNDGDTLQVFANLLDQHENVFSDLPEGVEIEWASDDETIVGVDAGGRLAGNAPGVTTVRATTADGLEATATVNVRAVATAIELVEGGAQDGLPNSPLADSVVMRVVDRHGNGVPGAEVRFRVAAGGGTISPSTVVSDADGLVRVEWTLGPVIGYHELEALSAGTGAPVDIPATISQVIFGDLDAALTATQGGTLPVTIRLNTELFPIAVGGAHLVLSWDPAKLAIAGGAVSGGDYARLVTRVDAAAGELHLVATDPAMTRGDMTPASFTFDVIGGAGTGTVITLEIEQLVGIDFQDASAAGVAQGAAVTIN